MKIVIIILLCIMLATAAWGQKNPSAALEAATQISSDGNTVVSLTLKDVSTKDALDSLFKTSNRSYVANPELLQQLTPAVTLSLKNVPFDVAFKAICQAAGLSYNQNGGVYNIQPRILELQELEDRQEKINSELVTDDFLPESILEDVLMRLKDYAPYEFDERLLSHKIKGASFYQFPRKPAARMIIKCNLDLPKAVVYRLEDLRDLPAISIGACKTAVEGKDEWQMTILADQAPDIELLKRMLQTVQASYVLNVDQQSATGAPGSIRAVQRNITAQLYDLTFDEALSKLLPAMRLSMKKSGTTYEINRLQEPPAAPKKAVVSKQKKS